MKLRFLIVLSLIATTAAGSTWAQEMRTLTDDTGVEVSVPVEPLRVVSLHDSVLTVPLLELGVTLVGSHGRGDSEESAFIRSSAAITGMDFNNTDIKWVGNYPADIERVAALNPDLILTTKWQSADVDQLRAIAPTVVIDSTVRNDDQIWELLADVTGTQAQLELMELRYQSQIDSIRRLIDTENITVSTLHVRDSGLFAYNPYGNIGKVLVDAGFKRPDLITEIPVGDTADFTAEFFPEFDGDFLITTFRETAGATPDDIRGYFDNVLPGWCDQLHACREDQMLIVSRSLGATNSYYALGAVTYMIMSEIGGREFTPMPQ
jgi:iron complex transport system substrate-binding protein